MTFGKAAAPAFALIVAAGLTATPAAAVSSATGWSYGSVFLVDWDGDIDALEVDGLAETPEADTEEVGDGYARVFVADASVSGPAGDAEVETLADTLDGFGVAKANGRAAVDWFLLNNGPDPITLYFEFGYDFVAETSIDAPFDEFAEQYTFLSLTTDTQDLFVMEALLRDNDAPVSESDVIEVSFIIPGGGDDTLYLEAISESYADAFAPIPLPAAAPLLLAGIGALVAFTRRRAS
jgi:hypothetical protein